MKYIKRYKSLNEVIGTIADTPYVGCVTGGDVVMASIANYGDSVKLISDGKGYFESPHSSLRIGENTIDNSDTSLIEKNIYISDWNGNRTGRLYSFIPTHTATYKFSFDDDEISYGSKMDTYGYLLDESTNIILTSNDDGNPGQDPLFTFKCTCWTKYYVLITPYDGTLKNVKGILTISGV